MLMDVTAGLLLGGNLLALGSALGSVTLFKAVNASGGIDQFLFASEERVAVGANFYTDVALVGGTRGEHVGARTNHFDIVIGRVDSGFHTEPFRNFDINTIVADSKMRKPPNTARDGAGGPV